MSLLLALDPLDWAIRALSLFNLIALSWLGLTVLLNAERRVWGTWMAGGALLLGGLFFAGQLTLVSRERGLTPIVVELVWRLGWLPFLGAPALWYLVMAWYTGVLRRIWQRVLLVAVGALGFAALVLLAVMLPSASYGAPDLRYPGVALDLLGAPIPILLYLLFSLLCYLISLLALVRPETPDRFMGDLARQRARPWLAGATIALAGVSLIVAAAGVWLTWVLRGTQPYTVDQVDALLHGVNALLSALIAVAVVLVGRAVVSYEIFTGKALPRGGLFRQWLNSLVLAAGYGLAVGFSMGLPIDPIYRLLLATLLLTLFSALLSWRSYLDRERSMDRLRPFVASERLYERLLKLASPPDVDALTPFRALCDDVLGARCAYLSALGPLAPLAGAPLVHPPGGVPPALTGLVAQLRSPDLLGLAVDPTHYGGAVWAVPLWSERGLIGVLLLGDKRDGGIYTQEEIEIARATGERLIDTQASTEIARRLMLVQRERLAESQVVDRRARQVLHDDVLPRLHLALLTLSAAPLNQATSDAAAALSDAHRQIATLLRETAPLVSPEVVRLGLVDALRQAVEGELGQDFDGVTWRIEAEGERVARALPALSAEVLFGAAREAIRNAARHGRGGNADRPLHLALSVAWREGLQVAIEDDGVGPGAAAAAAQGSGHGLALHSTMLAVIGGSLTADTAASGATRILLALPPHALAAATGPGE